jgi:hypothetical protein
MEDREVLEGLAGHRFFKTSESLSDCAYELFEALAALGIEVEELAEKGSTDHRSVWSALADQLEAASRLAEAICDLEKPDATPPTED